MQAGEWWHSIDHDEPCRGRERDAVVADGNDRDVEGDLLAAVLVTWPVYRARGYFRAWQETAHPRPIWWMTAADSVPASTAVTTFLVLASVMSHSGQTEVLALGARVEASLREGAGRVRHHSHVR